MKRNNRPSPIVTRPRALPASAARRIAPSFRLARERFGELNVDVEGALAMLSAIPISLHCWQGDDVRGFENANSALGGGLAVTGNYPGRARTAEELRMDLEQALSLIPGQHRVNLHAIYGEFGVRKVERTEIEPEHYGNWVRWAGEHGLGLDFNSTCFAHPQAADGLTLSHPDKRIRRFWIEHCIAARHVGSAMGIGLENPCVTNLWIPDGFKDTPADRVAPRERLMESLDEIFRQPLRYNLDAVEPKLFGIGAESCTVGSHEFYLGYAITRKKLLCLDAGHFHPTESIADKISSVLPFLPAILLHVSRGVRWDSDHVVTQTDDLLAIAREVVANDPTCRRPVARPAQAKRRKEAGGAPRRIHIGLDYFDASINRIAAWVIGARNVQRALLTALLEPPAIRESERSGDNTARLALQEEARSLPVGAVWDFFCESQGVPVGEGWLQPVKHYEQRILSTRD